MFYGTYDRQAGFGPLDKAQEWRHLYDSPQCGVARIFLANLRPLAGARAAYQNCVSESIRRWWVAWIGCNVGTPRGSHGCSITKPQQSTPRADQMLREGFEDLPDLDPS
jgi:hypothetical protein